MELSMQERLKDLRVERGLTLEQLAEQTHLSKSALCSCEGAISKPSAAMPLSSWQNFMKCPLIICCAVLTQKSHKRWSCRPAFEWWYDCAIEKWIDWQFPLVWVGGANAIVDAMSATIMKRHNPGLTDPQLRQLITAYIDEDSFCRYVIQQDINKKILDLREKLVLWSWKYQNRYQFI